MTAILKTSFLFLAISALSSAFTSIHAPKMSRRVLMGGTSSTTVCSNGTSLKMAASDDDGDVVTFRKPEFVSRIAEKTGMSKSDSEAALSAVLETITEVCRRLIGLFSSICFIICSTFNFDNMY